MTKATSSNKPAKKILGIDTSTAETVISINDTVVRWHSDRNQTNELLPKIDKLLTKLGIKPIQLDGVVVNLGPGSFTGLRVGVTVANGFGYGLGLPVAGIDKFQLLEKLYPKADGIILDAGRGEVFFCRKGTDAKLVKISDLARQLKSADSVCLDGPDLVPKVHEQLAKTGAIYIANLSATETLELMMRMAKLPKRFAQVLPKYVRGANITKPTKKKI